MVVGWLIAALAVTPKGDTVSFDVDGQKRLAIVFRPSASGRSKPAVYFVFHGLGGNAQAAVRQFHIQELDQSAMVVYAEGMPGPSDGRERHVGSRNFRMRGANTWQIMPRQYGDRDVHFVQSLLKWADAAGADSSRRYYVGHSNGSGFAWVVLKEIGNEFTRFVGMNGGTLLPLEGAPQKPVLLTSGTSDRLVSPSSVATFAEKLAAYNKCGHGSGSPVKTFPGANPVYLYEYNGGHMPPADVYAMAVKFCQAGKPN